MLMPTHREQKMLGFVVVVCFVLFLRKDNFVSVKSCLSVAADGLVDCWFSDYLTFLSVSDFYIKYPHFFCKLICK